MHLGVPEIIAAVISAAIIVIGFLYLVSPARILGGFGLKPPSSDATTLAWLRLKGVRDIASGLVVLALLFTASQQILGVAVLIFALIPLGDMSVVLGCGGSKATALSVHGVTLTVMLVVGLFLLHVI